MDLSGSHFECLLIVLKEWHHRQFAERDLDPLETTGVGRRTDRRVGVLDQRPESELLGWSGAALPGGAGSQPRAQRVGVSAEHSQQPDGHPVLDV
jgi:hypothetical protein